jgi:hypothetical protein
MGYCDKELYNEGGYDSEVLECKVFLYPSGSPMIRNRSK